MTHKSHHLVTEDSRIAVESSCTANLAEWKEYSHSINANSCTLFHTLYICSRTGFFPARFFYSPAADSPRTFNYSTPDNSITKNYTCIFSTGFDIYSAGFTPSITSLNSTPSGQAPAPSGHAPTTPGHAPTTPGLTPTTPGHAPMAPGLTPVSPGLTPVSSEHAPASSGFTPCITGLSSCASGKALKDFNKHQTNKNNKL